MNVICSKLNSTIQKAQIKVNQLNEETKTDPYTIFPKSLDCKPQSSELNYVPNISTQISNNLFNVSSLNDSNDLIIENEPIIIRHNKHIIESSESSDIDWEDDDEENQNENEIVTKTTSINSKSIDPKNYQSIATDNDMFNRVVQQASRMGDWAGMSFNIIVILQIN